MVPLLICKQMLPEAIRISPSLIDSLATGKRPVYNPDKIQKKADATRIRWKKKATSKQ